MVSPLVLVLVANCQIASSMPSPFTSRVRGLVGGIELSPGCPGSLVVTWTCRPALVHFDVKGMGNLVWWLDFWARIPFTYNGIQPHASSYILVLQQLQRLVSMLAGAKQRSGHRLGATLGGPRWAIGAFVDWRP